MSCPVRIMGRTYHASGSNIKQKYLFSFSLALHAAVGVLWATNPNDGKGRTMDTKQRLKHASEVLGWLAEGKKVQGRREIVGSDWEQVTEDFDAGFIVARIVDGSITYRIKPAPVEWCDLVVAANAATGLMVVYLPGELFKPGMRVKVTLLES